MNLTSMLRSLLLALFAIETMREDDYRKLLRRTLIAVGLCALAVLVCYFWIDRPVAFFVYRHQHGSGFSVADLPAAGSAELVGSGVDDPRHSTRVGTIFAVAEGAARSVSQLDRCR